MASHHRPHAARAWALILGSAALAMGCSPSPSTTPAPTPTQTVAPTGPGPTPVGSVGPQACAAGNLAARITGWDGAAGHRFGTFEMTNTAVDACVVPERAQPQLVDGTGRVLIDGDGVAPGGSVLLEAGSTLSAAVDTSNYCGDPPVAPVTVAIALPGTDIRIVAAPFAPDDVTGVPPCNGAPGSPGSIELRAWQP